MVETNKKAKEKLEPLHPGFKLEEGIAFGSRQPGLFEIKFHSPNKNALTKEGQEKLGELFTRASKDPETKVVLIHGGKYYGSGNNLKILMQWVSMTTEEITKVGTGAAG